MLLFVMPGCEPCHLSLALLRATHTLVPAVRIAIIEAGRGDSTLRDAAPARAAWFTDVDRTAGRDSLVVNYLTGVLVWKGRVLGASETVLDLLVVAALIRSESIVEQGAPG